MGSKIVFANNLRGTVPTAQLGSGTANTTTYLRGDRTWQALTPVQINSLTSASYTIGVGTTGSDVNVASAGSTITVHIPDAGASVRGVVTTGAQTLSGLKTFRQISIVGVSDAIELNVRAFPSGQVNPLQAWRDSSGAVIGSVSPIGEFDFGSAEFHVSAVGFFGVTPIARPTTAWATIASFGVAAGTNVTDQSTFDGYSIGQIVSILRAFGLLT